jgi:protein tyrosine/serine phosphatase
MSLLFMRERITVMRRLLIVLAFALASCRTAGPFPCDATAPARAPRNFGSVSEGVYRGGQPSSCAELAYLQSLGVKSILKLNDPSEPLEKEEAQRMGFRVASFAFNPRTIGRAETCGDVRSALAFLRDRGNWPVYIHCTAGKDRTGYLAGLYERLDLGRSVSDVMNELHHYGHRAVRSAAFSQIDDELRRERPQCAQ